MRVPQATERLISSAGMLAGKRHPPIRASCTLRARVGLPQIEHPEVRVVQVGGRPLRALVELIEAILAQQVDHLGVPDQGTVSSSCPPHRRRPRAP
jgi:hypothetical protein